MQIFALHTYIHTLCILLCTYVTQLQYTMCKFVYILCMNTGSFMHVLVSDKDPSKHTFMHAWCIYVVSTLQDGTMFTTQACSTQLKCTPFAFSIMYICIKLSIQVCSWL